MRCRARACALTVLTRAPARPPPPSIPADTRLATLNAELAKGAEHLDAWLKATKGTSIPYQVMRRDCC